LAECERTSYGTPKVHQYFIAFMVGIIYVNLGVCLKLLDKIGYSININKITKIIVILEYPQQPLVPFLTFFAMGAP
jgi:hypothetical protein